ncbi:hypothetical protein ACFL23_00205 [Patescibacteria group bacterium]
MKHSIKTPQTFYEKLWHFVKQLSANSDCTFSSLKFIAVFVFAIFAMSLFANVSFATNALGESCTTSWDCDADYCIHNICRDHYYFCGDGYCDEGYTICPEDCAGSVINSMTCDSGEDAECESGNCSNNICCKTGSVCCFNNDHCPYAATCTLYGESGGCYCESDATTANGGSCSSNTDCVSDNCQHRTCCEAGKECCKTSNDCGDLFGLNTICNDNYYCEDKVKKANGEACSQYSECESSICDYVLGSDYSKKICCGGVGWCCETDNDCGNNGLCNSNYLCEYTYLKVNGSVCASSEECASGYCNNGKCCDSGTCCYDDDDCSTGYECHYNKYCVEKVDTRKEIGEVCYASSTCKSENCANYVCCEAGKTCCSINDHCDSGYLCDTSNYYCELNLKADGEVCSNNSECESPYCLHSRCRSSSPYCGDGHCDNGEECDVCQQDCGNCRAGIGEQCLSQIDCGDYYCVHNICRENSTYCGDTFCDSDESCSSCTSDCGSCSLKIDGAVCNANSECANNYCVHGKCRSSSTYCGDSNCDTGETCDDCSDDCGLCSKPDGSDCVNSGECKNWHCVHGKCRSSETYCGDTFCDRGESCSSCTSDCGACSLKDTGETCGANSECKNNHCVHSKCRSSETYCGDTFCDSGETCVDCVKDCGQCEDDEFTAINSMSFGSSGEMKDGGVIPASRAPHIWTVNLPSRFTKVEITHYAKNSSNYVKKYMGKNGYVKVNDKTVWEFSPYSSSNGQVYDASLGKNVTEASGLNKWIDATKFFQAGSNTVKFYHYTTIEAIGVKLRVSVSAETEHTPDPSQEGNDENGVEDELKVEEGAEEREEEEVKKENGQSCDEQQDCASNNCVESVCRPLGYTWCGDGECQDNEDCSCPDCATTRRECLLFNNGDACSESSQCKSDFCWEKKCAMEENVIEYINEYSNIYGSIMPLNDKKYVPGLEGNFSPHDMHRTLMISVEEEKDGGNKVKAIALLKSSIAIEKLGVATIEAGTEMADVLGEATWQLMRTFLLFKAKIVAHQRLNSLSGKLNVNLRGVADKLTAATELVGGQLEGHSLESVLNSLGIESSAQIADFKMEADRAFENSQGSLKRYMDELEKTVKHKYKNLYKLAFMTNFKEAVSNQMVDYQVAIWHQNKFVGAVPNSDVPYYGYQTKINQIREALIAEKNFVYNNDNIFDKSKNMGNQLIDTTTNFGKLMDQLGLAGAAVDWGASLLGKETIFGDVFEKVSDFARDINDKLKLATDGINIAGLYGKAIFGIYSEGKMFAIYHNTASDWCEATIGDCHSVIRIPGTQEIIDLESVYQSMRPLGASIDNAIVKGGNLAYEFTREADRISNEMVNIFRQVANTTKTTLVRGVKKTKKFVVQATSQTGEAMRDAIQEKTEQAVETAENIAEEAAKTIIETGERVEETARQTAEAVRSGGRQILTGVMRFGSALLSEYSGNVIPRLTRDPEILQSRLTNWIPPVSTIPSRTRRSEAESSLGGHQARNDKKHFRESDRLWNISPAMAEDKPVIEFALISPSGKKYSGEPMQDGMGAIVVVEDPEDGEWETEVIGVDLEGEEDIEISLNVDEISEQETVEEVPEIKLAQTIENLQKDADRAIGIKKILQWVLSIAVGILAVVLGVLVWKRRAQDG